MTLGSIISGYKKGYKRKNINNYDIDVVVQRLEGYRKYKRQLQLERAHRKEINKEKVIVKLKKANYRKMYSFKPVVNPYIEQYTKLKPNVDPKLMERYRSTNIYMLYEFRHLKLPRSNYSISAGKAWNGLISAWTGYKIAKRLGDEKELHYANAVQKFAYYLEAPIMPSFENLPSYDFKLDLLKKY